MAGSTGVSGLSARGSRREEVGMPVQFPSPPMKELWHLQWQRDTSGYSGSSGHAQSCGFRERPFQ